MTTPSPGLCVLFVSPECAPIAKVGGLADVSASLPPALRALGIDARLLLPGYPGVLAAAKDAREIARLTVLPSSIEVRLLEEKLPSGVPMIILDSPQLFQRGGGPYQDPDGEDWPDNAERFGALSRIAAILGGAASPLDWRPQVIHCNDWPAALAPAYLRYAPPPRAATVMTIHNLAFQGNVDPEWVALLGLPPSSLAVDGLEFHGRMSFLKAGLFYSDAITTVSPTYAREVQSAELGFGLEGLLRHRRESLFGILNGIDTVLWDPKTDPHIARQYGADTLDEKWINKKALQGRLKLPADPDIPLLGIVSRLTHQKGADLLAEAAQGLAELPVQLAVLGTGEREMEEALRAAASKYPERIAVIIGFDEELAHLVEAGADMFLMPSRFEPCGMNQMYSQRYGTPPVARATGGLVDTVSDYSPGALADGRATGFLFREPTAAALLAAVRRALTVYRNRRNWRALQRNAMARDFGWKPAAREYAGIYARLVGEASRTPIS
jgi:starch synthase